jgi:mRNA interferase MazF
MGLFTVRTIAIVPFPFSDSDQAKVRPALCIAEATRGEWILCQITSTGQGDPNAISLALDDFEAGGLHHHSFVRPAKLFTAHEKRIKRSVGTITVAAHNRVIDSLISILRS